MGKIALAVHGGAGTIRREEMTPELEISYRQGLEAAIRSGWEILSSGGRAPDAVEAAVRSLEDDPLFNAGRGSVLTCDEKIELDAAIMDGESGKAGAVAFVRNVKNPVSLARAVMDKTVHVLLAGQGANEFAREINAELRPDDYFFTEHRYRQLLIAKEENVVTLDHSPANKIGTVGAVACDSSGNIAAATSTGGMTNKKFGRVGDTPIIGAGTFADNSTCAVSCTGHGEFFIRSAAAYDVSALIKYKGLTLADAAETVIENLRVIGGEGGLIAVDRFGNLALPFNSEGMYRGWVSSGEELRVEIYR